MALSLPQEAYGQRWFVLAFCRIDFAFDVPVYGLLVAKWVQFEELHGFRRSEGRLNERYMPVELKRWYNKGKMPAIGKGFVETFSRKFRVWWRSLQPIERVVQDSEVRLTSLDKHGKHGWYGLMLCIKWWGEGIMECSEDERLALQETWKVAMQEMLQMLDRLLAYRQLT